MQRNSGIPISENFYFSWLSPSLPGITYYCSLPKNRELMGERVGSLAETFHVKHVVITNDICIIL